MVVDECDGISRSELEHRIVKDRLQVIARPHLAGSMEVVMQGDVEKRYLEVMISHLAELKNIAR